MRFSLRTLFAGISAFAVYCALVFAVFETFSFFSLLFITVVMFPVIITGVVYDKGYARTFWIGCASSAFLPILTSIYYSISGVILVIYGEYGDGDFRLISYILASSHGLTLLCGCIAMAARWLIETKNRRPQSDVAFNTSILHGRVSMGRLNSFEPENE